MASFVLFALIICATVIHQSVAQTGVCYVVATQSVPNTYYVETAYTSYYSCGLFGWSRCSRTTYSSTARYQTLLGYVSQFACCSGYSLVTGTQTCADNNECSPNGGKGPCAQICTNTAGSFTCSCYVGYTLSGYSCYGPNITWNGQVVKNNSLVSLSVVLQRVSASNQSGQLLPLVCQGVSGEQWYGPSGVLFPLAMPDPISTPGGLGQRNVSGGVELYRGTSSVFPHGVQCCTNTFLTLCVGMYTDLPLATSVSLNTTNFANYNLSVAATYGPNITGGVQFQLLTPTNVDPPVFQLTCTSTSSPPTDVLWTINGSLVNGSNYTTSTMVTKRPNSTYNNTLTVTGRAYGMYTCNITTTCSPVCGYVGFTLNPRSTNASLTIEVPPGPPNNVISMQSGPTSVSVYWTAPTSGSPVIRYDIYYVANGGSSTSGGSTNSTGTSYVLTNLQSALYTIAVIAVGIYLPSQSATVVLNLDPKIIWNGQLVKNNSLVSLSVVLQRVNASHSSGSLFPQQLFPLVCQGIASGQWYGPSEVLFPLAMPDPAPTPGGLGQQNVSEGVELYRGTPSVFPHGVQCCTNTIITLCVGMYSDLTLATSANLSTSNFTNYALSVAATYGPNITGGVQFQLLTPTNVDPQVFQLTCTSNSSPPTDVLWTINGNPVNGSNYTTSKLVIERPTSTYNNTLIVTGRAYGMYTCSVTTTCSPVCGGFTLNPRSTNASLTVRAPPGPPNNIFSMQSGSTSVSVYWTAPTSGSQVIRYDVYYAANGSSSTSAGSTNSTETSYVLTNLQFGVLYTISVIAVGTYLPSQSATVMLNLKSCTFNEAANKMAPNITVMIESGVSLNITMQPGSVSASLDSQVTLICQTSACSHPLTTWYKDNVVISNVPRLVIPALELSDRGLYVCKSGDMSSVAVRLSVKGVYQYLVQIKLNTSATVDSVMIKLASLHVLNNNANITKVTNFSYSGSSLNVLFTLAGNYSISYDHFSNELKALLLVALGNIEINITSIARFDGCPLAYTCDDKYVWLESEIGTVDTSYSCIQRLCGGTYSTGGLWEPVVFTCANDYATCALKEWEDLLPDAVNNTEVAGMLLRRIDNFLDTKQQIQDSARLLNILNYYSNNAIINETTVFTGRSFATQLEDISGCLTGRNFSVNLGSVDAALVQNNTIYRSAISSSRMENTTASVLVLPPPSNECAQSTMSIYRLTFYTFLQNVLFQSSEQEKEGFKIGSIIISVGGNAVSLAEKLQFSFQVVKDATNAKPAQWINDSTQAGVWSTEGFRILSTQNNTFIAEVKLGSKTDRINSRTAYQGNFAMLLDLNPDSVKCPAADIVTQIGIVLSIISLLFFLVTYICSKPLRRSEHGAVLINMSFALICLYIAFLMATYSKTIPALCGISAASVHYFMLVYVMWTAAEAVFLFFKLVKVLGSKINRFTLKAGLISWLVPLGIVIISVGAGYRYYYNSNYCRASELPFYLGFISPFIAIYIFNWIMFIIIMVSLCKTSTRSAPNNSKGGNRHKLRNNVTIAAGLALVLGLGWGFGLAASSNNFTVLACSFQFLFSVFVGCQGLLILFFHGVRNKNVKKAWRSWIGLHTKSYTVTMSVRPGEGDAMQSHGETESNQHTSCTENQPSLSQDDTSCDEPPQKAGTTEKKLVDKGLQLFEARVERYAASNDENVSEKDAAQNKEPASSDEPPQKAASTTERKLIDEGSFKASDGKYVVSINEKVLEKEVVQKKAPRSFISLSLLKKNTSGATPWFRSDSQVTAVLLRSEEDKDDDNSAMI